MIARAIFALLLLSSLAPAQDADWREGDLPEELNAAAVRRLGHDRVLLGTEEGRQVFEFYVASPYPVFVTSDSILNAYHVLFEESILRLEEARAIRLPEVLHGLWRHVLDAPDRTRMDLPQDLVTAAQRRARIAIGTAIVLLGEEPEGAAPDVAKIVKEEAARVVAAEGTTKPAWLGPPDPGFVGIDYALFRPRGFYDRSEDLRRYFRAVAWLMAIPFRPDRDEELLAFLLLAESVGKRTRSFLAGYPRLLGPGDDPTIAVDPGWWVWPFTTVELAKMRETYREMRGEMNDLVAYASGQATLRILAAARTPDGVMFERTVSPLGRSRPHGLEIPAALGSGFARSVLEEKSGEKLLAAIDRARPAFGMEGLYADYLRCLAALVDEPPEAAPDLFRGPAWAAKSCQTVLAGWAQLRHTWELHAKRNVNSLGVSPRPHGFVEPNPEFFTRLGALARKTRALLEEQGAFDPDHDRMSLARMFDRLADALARAKISDFLHPTKPWRDRSPEEQQLAVMLDWESETPESVAERRKLFRARAANLRDPGKPVDEETGRWLEASRIDLGAKWGTLAQQCESLAEAARQQLAGEEPAAHLFADYGRTLGSLMLYDGNTFDDPRDDAPRVATVYSDPRRGRYLAVGVARPRALWVLYPWKGRDVLCRGGVLPYREVETAKPLTDEDWKARLDGEDAPPVPEWLAPYALGR